MVFLNNYQSYSNGLLELSFSNGVRKLIRLTKDSGRIVTRKKVDTVSNVNHPGIYVGVDVHSNEAFILHNHYRIFKTAGVSPFEEYASGEEVRWDNRICVNNKMKVLQKGLDQAIRREKYHWLTNNCQVTVNDACSNQRTSEDVGKWIGRIALGVFAAAVIKVATS